MGGALGATALFEAPLVLAVVASTSFAWLVLGSDAWTPSGRFGAANALTSARLLLVMALGVALPGAPGVVLATLVTATLLLDGADGWLARRLGLASTFGAHFDMEVDAFLVLTTSVTLWLSGRSGAWLLFVGSLRYAYVLSCALWPPRGGEMPRTLLGRSAFALVVMGHALGFALTGAAATLAVALGSAAVTLSFARSFWYGYVPAVKPAIDS